MTEDLTIGTTYPDETEWTAENITASWAQGWGVFDSDGSDNGRTQLCRWDEQEKFPTDEAAWDHVAALARQGDPLAWHALDVVRRHNPAEWHCIIRHCGEIAKPRVASVADMLAAAIDLDHFNHPVK